MTRGSARRSDDAADPGDVWGDARVVLDAAVGHEWAVVVLPRRYAADAQVAGDAFELRAVRRCVEAQPQPARVDVVDPIGDASQPAVGAEHAVARVAEVAAAEER